MQHFWSDTIIRSKPVFREVKYYVSAATREDSESRAAEIVIIVPVSGASLNTA